jgi:polysaccharide pyruvyl transferase WcaK-like protein
MAPKHPRGNSPFLPASLNSNARSRVRTADGVDPGSLKTRSFGTSMTTVRLQACKAMPYRRNTLDEKPFGVKVRTELKQKQKKISCYGHFGCGNFGNEVTLQAALYHLRRRLPDSEIRCICTGPAATATTHNIATEPISRTVFKAWTPHNRVARLLRTVCIGIPSELYRWLEAVKTLKGTDVLIVPGTGLLTDAYCITGWGPYSTFKWSVVARLCGCKLLFVSVGAGPIYRRLSRFLVKSALALANFRSYRDTRSMQYLKGIGFVRTNDRIYPDLAFSLPQALIPYAGGKDRRRPVVGLGLMEYAGRYSVDKPVDTTYRNYLDNLALLVDWLLSREYDVRLLIGDVADRPVTREFKRLLKERLSAYDASRIIDEPVDSVEQLLSQLAGTDLVVATRFHNVLLALLSNKPTVAISFHHKCTSLMSAMGMSEYCLDINDLKADKLIEQFRQMEKNAAPLKTMIGEKTEECRKALDDQYDLIFQALGIA